MSKRENIMLSEISQTGKDKYWMISLICRNLKKKVKLIETQNDSYQGLGHEGHGKLLVKGYKPSVTRCISSGDLRHSMVIIVNNILYI